MAAPGLASYSGGYRALKMWRVQRRTKFQILFCLILVHLNLNSFVWLVATTLDSASLPSLGPKLSKIRLQSGGYVSMDYTWLLLSESAMCCPHGD